MLKKLISLDELRVEDLPLEASKDGILFITEDNLERFLIVNRYNIYNPNEELTYQEVIDNDWSWDSTMINDAMFGLGFEAFDDENEERSFYIPKAKL